MGTGKTQADGSALDLDLAAQVWAAAVATREVTNSEECKQVCLGLVFLYEEKREQLRLWFSDSKSDWFNALAALLPKQSSGELRTANVAAIGWRTE